MRGFLFAGLQARKKFKKIQLRISTANKIIRCYKNYLAAKNRIKKINHRILRIIYYIIDKSFSKMDNETNRIENSVITIQRLARGIVGRERYFRIYNIRKNKIEKAKQRILEKKKTENLRLKFIEEMRKRAMTKIQFFILGFITRQKYVRKIHARTLRRLKYGIIISNLLGALYRGRKARKKVGKIKDLIKKKEDIRINLHKLKQLRLRSGTFLFSCALLFSIFSIFFFYFSFLSAFLLTVSYTESSAI